MKTKNNFLLVISIFYCFSALGQMDTFNKKVKLNGITEKWHNIIIPNTVFNEVKDDLSDVRIYGVTPNDTLEAPYVLKVLKGENSTEKINFKLINSTKNSKGYYFTYETNANEILNRINLNFKNLNFDWQIVLEASHNQNEWFTILNNYRVLSITNDQTEYRFTTLKFKDSKYKYYRVRVKTDDEPALDAAGIFKNDTIKPTYQNHEIKDFKISEEGKTTVIDISLKQKAPISYLKLNIDNKIDFYRSVSFQYITDSVNTEKGWKYNYRNMGTKVLSSLENNEFTFKTSIAQKLHIRIENYDNQPLQIKTINAKGYKHQLTARFTEPGDYYLTYGNSNAYKPTYDISLGGFKLPENTTTLKLGNEEIIPHQEFPAVAPLFENKWWLWGIMGIVILVLGGFTLKMMQKKG